jgi:hypothetical protein
MEMALRYAKARPQQLIAVIKSLDADNLIEGPHHQTGEDA